MRGSVARGCTSCRVISSTLATDGPSGISGEKSNNIPFITDRLISVYINNSNLFNTKFSRHFDTTLYSIIKRVEDKL